MLDRDEAEEARVDGEILRLERLSREDGSDPWTRYRWRMACVRAGRPEAAGIEVGDLVCIQEVESPWVRGTWIGEVLRVFEAGDKYVRPVERDLPYRVRPSAEYLAKGLYLTREDVAALVRPAMPKSDVGERREAA